MSVPDDISDEAMLARLAACDLSAAERVHGKLMAAEEAGDIAELGRTYQRIARSLRQTLALKAKLKHDAEQAARDAPPVKPSGVALARRRHELHDAVLRVIWNEAEPADFAEFAEELLDEQIALEGLSDDFCAEPLDDQVARVCHLLGLSPKAAKRWRDLADPDAPDEADAPSASEAEPPRRDSG